MEDLIGAGAIIKHLHGSLSPESYVALAAYESAEGHLLDRLLICCSGRELVERGFVSDVEIAAELDASEMVPILRQDAFVAST